MYRITFAECVLNKLGMTTSTNNFSGLERYIFSVFRLLLAVNVSFACEFYHLRTSLKEIGASA